MWLYITQVMQDEEKRQSIDGRPNELFARTLLIALGARRAA